MSVRPPPDGRVSDRSSGTVVWMIPLLIAATAILLEAGGDAARLTFRFDRSALGGGELWRLLSGHLVHLGPSHLLLNLAGLGLVWALVGARLTPITWAVAAGIITFVIDAGLWYLRPSLDWYVGLSGLLHGLLVLGMLVGLREAPLESVVMLAAVGLKLGYEQLVGPLPGSTESAGGPVVVDAHLYGAIGGLLAAAWLQIRVRAKRPL